MNNKKPRIINGLYIVDEIDTSPNGGVDAGYEQGLADAVVAIRKESHLLVLDAWIEERLAASIAALEEK